MKKTILILLLSIATNLTAQKDTLYFNSAWNKVTDKTDAAFFRPLPLKKVGDLHQIKDYYINGNLQMDGYWSDIENETLEGKVSWYYENGKLSQENEYKNGSPHGKSTYYTKEGFLRATGAYKNGQAWNGTVPSLCCPGRVSEFKEGDEIAYLTFYKGLPQLAKKEIFGEGDISKILYYDKNGDSIGQISYKDGEAEKGEFIWFYMDGEQAVSISNLIHYINGKLEGEEISYSENGEIITKGTNKNDAHWNGSFIRSSLTKEIVNYKVGKPEGKQTVFYNDSLKNIKSYLHIINGKKEGESAYFYKDGKELSKGIFKNDKPWNGTFFDNDNNTLSSYKEGEKHGLFIQYGSEGEIVQQQEYKNGEITGLVKSKGYFKDKTCECQYKNGQPFSGEVCKDVDVEKYENGLLTLTARYDDELAKVLKRKTFYKDSLKSKQIIYYNNKEYELTFKNDEPLDGVDFDSYDEESITYVNGEKHGAFFNLKNALHSLKISGHFKNGRLNGTIHFNDSESNKKTACTYNEGEPIDGVSMEDNFITTYKNSKKHGLETTLRRDEFYGKIYDSIVRNYKQGKLDGDITYYKEGQKVASGSYKANQPYQDTVFEGQYRKNTYHKGELRASTLLFKFNEYKKEIIYVEKTAGRDGNVTTTLDKKELASGIFKNEKYYDGKFVDFDDLDYPTELTFVSYKNGKKNGVMEVFDIQDDKIVHSFVYKNDIPLKKTWAIPFKNKKTIEGDYKNEKPFSGFFYAKDNIIEMITQYESGVKNGYQYYAVAGSNMENLLDSISYVKGKPFKGGKLVMYNDQTHQHIYEEGQLTKTNIYNWGVAEVPHTEVIYTANGFVTNTFKGEYGVEKTLENTIKEKTNQVTFSNAERTSGSVVFYSDNEDIGGLTFADNKIKTIDFSFVDDGVGAKVYKKEPETIVIVIENKDEHIVFHPDIKLPESVDYNCFVNFAQLMFKNDGTVFYYLDSTKKPYSSCTIKNGKPYHGIVIRKFDGTYHYEEYRDGEEYKEVKKLSKKELLKLLK